MKEIAHIIVPVDLDKNTEKLVDFAVYVADRLGSTITFIHGIEFVTMGEMALGNFSYNDYNSTRVSHAESRLDEIVRTTTGKGRPCSSKVLIGDVVDEIVTFAKSEGGDLIVIGTHGKRGLEKILLGSVAERVLKAAHCPVLVMNPYR